MFGKWHIGQDAAHHPSQRGFDEAIVSMGAHFDFNTTRKRSIPKGDICRLLTDKPSISSSGTRTIRFSSTCRTLACTRRITPRPRVDRAVQEEARGRCHNNPTYAAMIRERRRECRRVMAKLAN